jgi:hypothetical protein
MPPTHSGILVAIRLVGLIHPRREHNAWDVLKWGNRSSWALDGHEIFLLGKQTTETLQMFQAIYGKQCLGPKCLSGIIGSRTFSERSSQVTKSSVSYTIFKVNNSSCGSCNCHRPLEVLAGLLVRERDVGCLLQLAGHYAIWAYF